MGITITLHNLDAATEAWIQQEVARSGETVEAVASRLLRRGLMLERDQGEPRVYDDLDWMIGSWNEEEAAEFEAATAQFEQVDPSLWQG